MKILFGVFDWGLGHATRNTPIIEELIKRNEVHLLSTGRALKLLQNHFKDNCQYFDVGSVSVPYPKSRFFTAKFAFSIPKMLSNLKKARNISKDIIRKNKYDLVISDCRYDVFDKKENSFLLNHQLKFKSQFFQPVTEIFLNKAMQNFGKVFVPDFENRELTGDLSFNKRFGGNVEFIGHLSRIKKKKVKEDIDYFITISGPEPQRTIFEEKILKQVFDLKGKVVIAGGTPDIEKNIKKENIHFFSFLDLKKQEEIMNKSKFIISRPGYSTVMELVELGKKNVLFIPTVGQTEQEYLADLYEEKGFFHHVHQNNFDLKKDIDDSLDFKGFTPYWKTEKSVKKFVKSLCDY